MPTKSRLNAMHENSLPSGDRTDQAAAIDAEPVDQRAAIVVQLAGGKYFKAWRHRGAGHVAVQSVARARLFSPHAREVLDATLAKLQRNGIPAVVIDVRVIVGDAG
jgi:hypothetical protein